METLILKNGTEKDLDRLMEFASKLGLDLVKTDSTELLNTLAKAYDESQAPESMTMDEIVEEVKSVRKQ